MNIYTYEMQIYIMQTKYIEVYLFNLEINIVI